MESYHARHQGEVVIASVLPQVPLTGSRFLVTYRVFASAAEIDARVRSIALEQTVEFPEDLLPRGYLKDEVPGRIEALTPAENSWFRAVVSYPDEAVDGDLLQFLNVVFGNTSLQEGVRVEDFTLPVALARGPRFGVAGVRKALKVPVRPLASTALKPLGLPVTELALQAYQTALGGLDIIKDDHGLADQAFAPFQRRVERCVEAVAAANRETGLASVYAPNVTADPATALARARFAQEAGVGAVLVSPGLAGFGVIRSLAEDPDFSLPILAHPAFTGSFVSAGPGGMDHALFYGTLMRAAGADITIFPNYGGRFSFSRETCLAIAARCGEPRAGLLPILPAPGGGMSVGRVADLKQAYGNDFVALVGGGLHREAKTLVEASRRFVEALAAEGP
jgi:ribulose-bisphosphate carboxylase large chain